MSARSVLLVIFIQAVPGGSSDDCCLTASITGDPHVTGAHSDRFSLRGEDGGIYCMLSAPNVSLNAQFELQTFTTLWSKMTIRGSFVRNAFFVLRTPKTGHMLQVAFYAREPHQAVVDNSQVGRFLLGNGASPFIVEGINISLRRKKLTVELGGRWRISAESTNTRPHPNVTRMNIRVTSLYHVCAKGTTRPRGILGETFDCDGMAVHGRQDSYAVLDSGLATAARRASGGTVTTRAQGEGALEGNLSAYRTRQPFDTEFAHSRFWPASFAGARNSSRLRGKKTVSRRRLTSCPCVSSPELVTFDTGTTALSPEPGKLVASGSSGGWGIAILSSTAITEMGSLKGVAFTGTCYNACDEGGTQYGMLGLASGTGTSHYSEIDFGIFLYAGEMQVREEGTIVFGWVGNHVSDWTRGTGWDPAVGNRVSVWEVRITTAGAVQYARDGNVFHTSTKTIVWPLHVTADFASTSGGGFDHIRYLTASEQASWNVSPSPSSPPTCPAIPSSVLSSISEADNLPDGEYEVKVSDCSTKVLRIVHLTPDQAWAIVMYKSGCCVSTAYGTVGDPPTYSDHAQSTQLAGRQHPLFTTDAVGDPLTFTDKGDGSTYSEHNFKLSDAEMNYLTSQTGSVGVFLVPGWDPETPTQNTQGNLVRANDGGRAYPIGGSTAGSTNHHLHVETAPGTDMGDLAKYDPSASTAYPTSWGTSLHDNNHCGGPAVWSWIEDYTTAWAFRWGNYGGCSHSWGGCNDMPNGISEAHADCISATWVGRLYAFAR